MNQNRSKKIVLLAAAFGATALALTACGSSNEAVQPTDLTPVESLQPVEPTDVAQTPTPLESPSPSGTTPPGTVDDPIQSPDATKLTVATGDEFTITFNQPLGDGEGITLISDNGVTAEPTDEGINFEKKSATYVALQPGTVRLAIGSSTQDGTPTGNWVVYEVTVK